MDAGRDLVDTRPEATVDVLAEKGPVLVPETSTRPASPPIVVPLEAERPNGGFRSRVQKWGADLRWPVGVYLAVRALLLVVAFACDGIFHNAVRGTSLTQELSNWDGWWYIHLATRGYLTHVSHGQTTLGFFPVYSMSMWLVAHVLASSYLVAGLLISGIGGLIATVLAQRLVTQWWGPEVARKAVLFFCIFPGVVVFSMDYSEGLLIPLIAGCLLALSKKRWLLAGLLAGLASGIGPDALVVVPTCAAASFVQFRQHGWRDHEARRSLIAPILSPLGAVGFAAFLWAWTGTPFASYTAQADGWHEKTSPLAVPALFGSLLHEVGFHFHFSHINLNNVLGILGTVFLVFGLIWLWRDRKTVPLEVLVFVGCMAFLMVTSMHVPPNPRLLITAFPVVVIYAKRLNGRAWARTLWLSGVLLVLLSALTMVGGVLRP